MGNAFREMKEYRQNKRAENRESSRRILEDRGIDYDSKNGGAHLIIFYPGGRVDFWPGTGKYIDDVSGKSGRGVFNLVKLIKGGTK